MTRRSSFDSVGGLYVACIILVAWLQCSTAQTLPPTADWRAPLPPNVWIVGAQAAKSAWESEISNTGSPVPVTESVTIVRLIGPEAMPLTPDKQRIAIEACRDVMPTGGLLEFLTYSEGIPEPSNPDTKSNGEVYSDLASILWQLTPNVTGNATVAWGTQAQALLLWEGALARRGLTATMRVMTLSVAESILPRKVQALPVIVIKTLLEVQLLSALGFPQSSSLTANQSWIVESGIEEYTKGWVVSYVEARSTDPAYLAKMYPDAINFRPGWGLIELDMSVYPCQADTTAGGKGDPPPNCEVDVARQVLSAFLESFNDTMASNGMGTVNILAAVPRESPQSDSDAAHPATENQDAQTSGQQPAWMPWHLDMLDQRSQALDGKYTATADGTGVNIYLVSSGIQADHSEFAPRGSNGEILPGSRVQGLWGFNGIDPKTDCPDGALWYSFGTYAASLIAGATVGIARNATLHSVRMREACLLDSRNIWKPGGLPSALDAVLSTFKAPGVVAIDTWWSPGRLSYDDDEYIQREITSRLKKAEELGIPIVTAASVGISTSTPCDNVFTQGGSVISVGGIDRHLHASITGARNSPCIDMWAPGGGLAAGITGAAGTGVNDYTTVVPRGFGAAWLVTGMAAQYLQLHPNATVAELREGLLAMATVGIVDGAGPLSPNLLAYTDMQHPSVADTDSSSGSGISVGAIVGIVVGCLVASFVAIAAFVVVSRRRRRSVQHLRPPGPSNIRIKNDWSSRGQRTPPAGLNGSDPWTPSPGKSVSMKHDWEISEDQIDFIPGPDGAESWALGQGQYGEVRRALKDGIQAVAVKTLRRDTAALGELPHDAFAREIAMMQWLSRDANVVQFFGACVRPGSMMLVTELMEGGDLRSRLRSTSDSATWGWYERGKGAALDVARGLHFLHSHGVVHRDVKSKNILLGRDGRAKLGDVGLAYISFSKTPENERRREKEQDDGFVGTFAFSAPEMILCGSCTPKADVYSFGVVLWEIITRQVAVRGRLRPPIVPDECPQDVVDIMNQCLSADPDERPSAREAYEALLACPPLSGYGYDQTTTGTPMTPVLHPEITSLTSLQSESLPSISIGSGSGPIVLPAAGRETRNGEGRGGETTEEDTQGLTSGGYSSLAHALGALTPGLRSVVSQIRKRLAGDGEETKHHHGGDDLIAKGPASLV